jgi:AraC-like DNA-binding protein
VTAPFAGWIGPFLRTLGQLPVFPIARQQAWKLDELCEAGWLAQFGSGLEQALCQLLEAAWVTTQKELQARPNYALADLGLGVILGAPEHDHHRICGELLVSSSYSARMFRRRWDATFVELRNRARAVTFLSISRHPGVNLTACALAAGFGSYSQAHRVFRTVTGRSPSEYMEGGRIEQALCDYRSALTPWALDVVSAARSRRSQQQGADVALASRYGMHA